MIGEPLGGQVETSAPALSFAERKAKREEARRQAEEEVRQRMHGKMKVAQGFIDWMDAATECDWCGIVAPRHDFAELDRDEAGLPKDNEEGVYNSCDKCSDARDAHEELRHLEEAISRGEYDDYDENVSLLTEAGE